MGGSEQAGSRTELGGGHWALLPALFFLPWLSGTRVSPTSPDLSFLVLAFLMASYDLACRRIPNPLTAAAAAWGLVSSWILGGPAGLVGSLEGGLVGFGLFAVFFFLGALGGGDVKALGALGTFLGPLGALQLFVFTTLAGGLLALLIISFGKLRKGVGAAGHGAWGQSLPYGLAILTGALAVTLAA